MSNNTINIVRYSLVKIKTSFFDYNCYIEFCLFHKRILYSVVFFLHKLLTRETSPPFEHLFKKKHGHKTSPHI